MTGPHSVWTDIERRWQDFLFYREKMHGACNKTYHVHLHNACCYSKLILIWLSVRVKPVIPSTESKGTVLHTCALFLRTVTHATCSSWLVLLPWILVHSPAGATVCPPQLNSCIVIARVISWVVASLEQYKSTISTSSWLPASVVLSIKKLKTRDPKLDSAFRKFWHWPLAM